MKVILLFLLVLASCSMVRFYQGPALSQELRKNATSLELVATAVESDFQQKVTFFSRYQEKGHDSYIKTNLREKLRELEQGKLAVLHQADHLRELNDGLLRKVADRKVIREGDPDFMAIESFAGNKDQAVNSLINEYGKYQRISAEFEKLAFFTRMVKN